MSEFSCRRNYDIGRKGSITMVTKYNVGLITKDKVGHERWSRSTTVVVGYSVLFMSAYLMCQCG